jgi:hypothetical protein
MVARVDRLPNESSAAIRPSVLLSLRPLTTTVAANRSCHPIIMDHRRWVVGLCRRRRWRVRRSLPSAALAVAAILLLLLVVDVFAVKVAK